MPRYIGVISRVEDVESLKRAALFFDMVVCDRVPLGVAPPRTANFINTGLRKMVARHAKVSKEENRALALEVADHIDSQVVVLEESAKARYLSEQKRMSIVWALQDCVTRIYAEPVSRTFPDDVVLPLLRSRSLAGMNTSSRTTIVHVVMNAMPAPSGDTPWEAIVDWRADEDAVEKYRQLRAWIARAAKQPVQAADVSDELAAMLTSYKRYMSIQHKKMKLSRLEAVIIPIAEACEDLMRLKLSSAVKRVCGLIREDVQLLEAECRAPGREVAYIAAADERFARRIG
jgi:hypothetical protein